MAFQYNLGAVVLQTTFLFPVVSVIQLRKNETPMVAFSMKRAAFTNRINTAETTWHLRNTDDKNMKRKLTLLIAFQSLFTVLQVYLISKISLLGRIGISIAYREYKFLRSEWKMYLLLVAVQLLVIGLFYRAYKTRTRRNYFISIGAVATVALAGLWFTYNDFTHTFSHRLLKEPFHLGFYLFWIGLIASCVFFAAQPSMVSSPEDEQHF
jgi:hypothetical protein